MADITAEDGEAEGAASAPATSRRFGRRAIALAGGAVVLLGLAAGAIWYFDLLGSLFGSGPTESKPKTVVFYDLPEMLVNLSTTGKQASYLKLRVSLELNDPEAGKRLDQLMPRVIDNFQVYLRELRMDDLNGSAGLYRLKEELLLRVNLAVQPVRVADVLFKEMLVQ